VLQALSAWSGIRAAARVRGSPKVRVPSTLSPRRLETKLKVIEAAAGNVVVVDAAGNVVVAARRARHALLAERDFSDLHDLSACVDAVAATTSRLPPTARSSATSGAMISHRAGRHLQPPGTRFGAGLPVRRVSMGTLLDRNWTLTPIVLRTPARG